MTTDVLIPAQMPDIVIDGLADGFVLHKLWEAPDPAAALSTLASKIRAIASFGGTTKVDSAYMAQFPSLEMVAHFGVGYDAVDAGWAGTHGIVVTNTPDVLNDEVADTALGLILCTVRELPQAERHLRAGRWPDGHYPLTGSLRGRTLGIVGLGRIGKAIATRAAGFGLKIVYHSRTAQVEAPYLYYPTLLGMARAVDIMVVITPGGNDTHHLINAEVLEALGPHGVLINVARGSVVDETALIDALRDKRIAAAGLDVFAKEPHVPQALMEMDNVVLLPHVGSASHHTRNAMGQLVVDNLKAWASGKGPLTPVAETPWPPVSTAAH